MDNTLFIGWDVGAWNCEKNGKSRDALVVLNTNAEPVGKAWRGNLRDTLASCNSLPELLQALSRLCDFTLADNQPVVIAIDTPLGFSADFVALLQGTASSTHFKASSENPYLFRETERFLFAYGYSPLSAVKDMIGSQATKGLHLLRKFGLAPDNAAIWRSGNITAFESYPSVLKKSALVQRFIEKLQQTPQWPAWHDDCKDAAYCAIAAFLYQQQPDGLATPYFDASVEGWIYVPKDCIAGNYNR